MTEDSGTDFPRGIGRPATGALVHAGYTRLRQLDGVPARDVLALHGVGSKAVRLLQEALAEQGMRMA
ncbi:DNA-binding protein [Actinomycetospora sp. CA-101289]|uniref:DNA-binding protein n=1 Tax=Actinomycetospora sp. CA-101289 TaxID=3239893 RepID=UPI003D99AD01